MTSAVSRRTRDLEGFQRGCLAQPGMHICDRKYELPLLDGNPCYFMDHQENLGTHASTCATSVRIPLSMCNTSPATSRDYWFGYFRTRVRPASKENCSCHDIVRHAACFLATALLDWPSTVSEWPAGKTGKVRGLSNTIDETTRVSTSRT